MELSSALKRIVRREIGAPGEPTLTQFRMLAAIRRGVRHVGGLSQEFGVSQPAASIMVSAMSRAGFIKKAARAEDRRRVELRLTAKAEKSLDTAYARAFSSLDRRLASLSASRREELGRRARELTRLLSS